MSNLL